MSFLLVVQYPISSGSVDFFRAIFVGVVRVSFRFSGSLASEKAKETVGLIQTFARKKATFAELEPSEEIRRWYTVLSCCVQRANARVLRGDAVPGRRTPPPCTLLAGRQDLALCGV